ncbi:hypothetical protein CEQ90_07590 [Lewinellaceae bacterium SD302]|nr:hypothetical protein CEQ90_07590 [Lewinellaceae bacterium SD302]
MKDRSLCNMKWIKVLRNTLIFAIGYLALGMVFEYFSSDVDFSKGRIARDSLIGVIVGFLVALRHRNG